MSISSRKRLPFNPPPPNGLASQYTQQPWPVCRSWSAHAPQSGPSPSPFPRSSCTLTATATATGEFFLFGGWVHGCASSDLYVFSTRDFSTTLLQTSGEVPSPRFAHGAALFGTTLLICGGKTNLYEQNALNHDSLYLLDLVSREWTRVMVKGPGPNGRHYPTRTVVGSKLFVFGGRTGGRTTNDMWALDLNCLKSQPVWESYEPTSGNEKPLPRAGHASVTTEDRIIIFGGYNDQHHYNDTWSFNISTRKWTELQCTGSIPSPRASHAAVLVDDVMYVFGGFTGKTFLDDLYALRLSTRTQRWFRFHNVGPSPYKRSHHTMASYGTRVFVLGGYSEGAGSDEISLIHDFDTKHIKYPNPERDVAISNERTTQFARRSSTVPPTQEKPRNARSSSSEASRLQNATAVSSRFASLQITHEQNAGPNDRPWGLPDVNSKPRHVSEDDVSEDDVSEGSTEYYAKFAAPHSFEEVTRLELERRLSVSLAAQTGRDQRIAQLTDELALKSALLEQAEANAVDAARRARPEVREHADDRRLMRLSLVKQRDAELLDMQARLRDMQAKLDELLLSRYQQTRQHEKELANMRAKLEAKESEFEAVRSQLTDAEKGWIKSKAEADILRAQTATGSVNRHEDQATRRLMERVQAIEAEVASRRWNEKSVESMDRNEG